MSPVCQSVGRSTSPEEFLESEHGSIAGSSRRRHCCSVLDRANSYIHSRRVGNAWQVGLQQYLDDDCNTRWIITTRLDNDDAMAPFLMLVVQDHFKRQRLTFVDFPKGYRLKDAQLHEHNEACNPFLSLIEKIRDKPRTVMSFEHGVKIAKTKKVVLGNMQPAWLQVIHERNKKTDKIKGKPIPPRGWVKKYV